MELSFSFIIPVYNRPAEIRELLESMLHLNYDKPFEVVIVEDGSTISSEEVVREFEERLKISYFKKLNSGPGDSRNFGMRKAAGNYFLILDSDVILPPQYLAEVEEELNKDFVHCFGGPDAAHEDFSDLQKAINYAMTSFLTTGGIRGGKKMLGKFQPRSFNMGLSKEAFEASGGFGRIHPGEDPDLALRLQKGHFTTRLFPEAFVFHKRRIDWNKFYQQVKKFGLVRPILNKWHPESAKITYWFPTLFSFGIITAVVFVIFGWYWLLIGYALYLILLFFHSWHLNGSLKIAFLTLVAAMLQFFGYGFGFCKSTCYLRFLNAPPEEIFPELFFKNAQKN
ncbi:glycosyltransferase [Salinimicrobium oceani]|uniref:Glycosyltransferase n=1 Tax=Salinimicrobium oceani TaxID=2722702 RepID=A0ABX1CYH5_9FLAO|nr:glycosyltransferase [Salinimicrobium oceani]NJW51458.1 glycosyltransferase [Salinimicrobium oceani]